MKVILLEAVDSLGTIGDVVSVRDGYARNFLFPNSKAVPATEGELKKLEGRRDKITKEKVKILESAQALGEAIKGSEIAKAVRVGDEGQLYGSVGVTDIVELLAAKGHEIEKKQVLLPEPIKSVGTFSIPIRLHQDVTVEISLVVSAEESKE